MKAHLILDIDIRGEQVWFVECVHRDSKKSRYFRHKQLFANEKDAREFMTREVQRVGMNMLEMWRDQASSKVDARRTRYCFSYDPNEYECSAKVLKEGKVVDSYVGRMYLMTIN